MHSITICTRTLFFNDSDGIEPSLCEWYGAWGFPALLLLFGGLPEAPTKSLSSWQAFAETLSLLPAAPGTQFHGHIFCSVLSNTARSREGPPFFDRPSKLPLLVTTGFNKEAPAFPRNLMNLRQRSSHFISGNLVQGIQAIRGSSARPYYQGRLGHVTIAYKGLHHQEDVVDGIAPKSWWKLVGSLLQKVRWHTLELARDGRSHVSNQVLQNKR